MHFGAESLLSSSQLLKYSRNSPASKALFESKGPLGAFTPRRYAEGDESGLCIRTVFLQDTL